MVHIISLNKIVVSEDFSEPIFQRGVQSFRRFLVFLVQKQVFFKKGRAKIAFFIFLFWWLLVDVATRL